MRPCVVIIWYVIPTRCISHGVFLFNLITALHVSGVTTTHPQEHKATASTTSGKHYTVLLSAAIEEKLGLIWVRVDQHATHNTPKSVPTFPR
jgi:hypothetical protein